jgi:3-hydroxyacyl-[acyl-carrier-protein] dehydratase
MSVLYNEIKASFSNPLLHDDGKRITARLCFPPEFTGFKGHFPGNPVVPGVCKVQSILVLLDLALGRRSVLKTIQLSKFLGFVTSGQAINVELRREIAAGSLERVKALFQLDDKKVAEVQIEVSYA